MNTIKARCGRSIAMAGTLLAVTSGANAAFMEVANDTLTWEAGEIELTAAGGWDQSSTSLMYQVFVDTDVSVGDSYLWKYVYTLNVPTDVSVVGSDFTGGGISHIIVEVSPSFTGDNILDGTSLVYEGPETFDGQGNSNPDIPGDLYGIKWNRSDVVGEDGNDRDLVITLISDIAPEWGDYYAKDGNANTPKTTLWNTGFTDPDPALDVDALLAAWEGNGYTALTATSSNGFTFELDHVMRPDSVSVRPPDERPPNERPPSQIPEPGLFALFGFGFAILGAARLRRRYGLDG